MAEKHYDILVIGGGPAGYVAAIRAAQLGFETACVEQREALGGTCLNVGCVPSKALLESSGLYAEMKAGAAAHGIGTSDISLDLSVLMGRKDKIVSNITKGVSFLFKKNGVTHLRGTATIEAPGRVSISGDSTEEVTCERLIVATGSRPKQLPGIPMDGDRIGDSTAALSYTEVPKSLAVIGAGAVGLELGTVWRRLGAEVTVLEYLDTILPGLDSDVVKQAARYFKRQKLNIKTGARVQSATIDGEKVRIDIEGGDPVFAERLLSAAGRAPNTEGLGLENTRVALDPRGFIKVDEAYATDEPGIFAIGDVVGGILLAHKASEEAVLCVEKIAGKDVAPLDPRHIPAVVYTEPEIAAVGMTETAVQEKAIPYIKGESLFRANARAVAHGSIDGSVKILAHKETEQLLGVHIIGPYAGELIAEAALALRNGLTVRAAAHTCHAHPSLAESFKEAAAATISEAVHG